MSIDPSRHAADNRPDRTFDVFFYGLNMDAAVLRARGVQPRDARRAWIPDYAVVLGAKAMLLRSPGDRAGGMVYRLTHDEMSALYDGLTGYRAEAVLAQLADGTVCAAVTMLHLEPPVGSTPEEPYASNFRALIGRLGLTAAD